VMSGPALRALRQAYPTANITLMASPAGSQVAPMLPWVNDVITWRAIWQEIALNPVLDPEKEMALANLLRSRQFDAAFISTSFTQSPHPPAYACYLAQIPLRVGQSKEFGGGLLTHWIRPLADSAHQVERSLHLLRECGIPAEDDRLEIRIPPCEQERADQILAKAGIGPAEPFLAIAPGASAQTRRYPEPRFVEAARYLLDKTGLPLVVIGSPREVGKYPQLEELTSSNCKARSLVGQTSLGEMSGILQRCALLIANNSGTMHIAAALQRPMVILFSGSELIEQWAPRNNLARLLNRPTGCTPCHRFQCLYQLECLDIQAEEIAAAAIDLLLTDTNPGEFGQERFRKILRR
jgi:lipopolysaccharide heptosyltransferase II